MKRVARLAVPVIVVDLALIALANCDPHFARRQAELAKQYGVRLVGCHPPGPPLTPVPAVIPCYETIYRCELDALRSREIYYSFSP